MLRFKLDLSAVDKKKFGKLFWVLEREIYDEHKSMGEYICSLLSKYDIPHMRACHIMLNEVLVPPQETWLILRDGDTISVKPTVNRTEHSPSTSDFTLTPGSVKAQIQLSSSSCINSTHVSKPDNLPNGFKHLTHEDNSISHSYDELGCASAPEEERDIQSATPEVNGGTAPGMEKPKRKRGPRKRPKKHHVNVDNNHNSSTASASYHLKDEDLRSIDVTAIPNENIRDEDLRQREVEEGEAVKDTPLQKPMFKRPRRSRHFCVGDILNHIRQEAKEPEQKSEESEQTDQLSVIKQDPGTDCGVPLEPSLNGREGVTTGKMVPVDYNIGDCIKFKCLLFCEESLKVKEFDDIVFQIEGISEDRKSLHLSYISGVVPVYFQTNKMKLPWTSLKNVVRV